LKLTTHGTEPFRVQPINGSIEKDDEDYYATIMTIQGADTTQEAHTY
jgi:hypothetical protein